MLPGFALERKPAGGGQSDRNLTELLKLKDGKLDLPKVPRADDLKKGLRDFFRR